MTRILYTGLLLFTSLQLFSSGPNVIREDLIVPVRAPRSVVPGHFETFILRLHNDYDYELHFEVKIDKPESWQLMSPVDQVSLKPGEEKSVLFLMDIDRACEIGPKEIRFEFYDKDREVKIVETVVTSVENIHELEVRAVRYPRHLTSGQEFDVEYVVKNLGNCYEKLSIASGSGEVSLQQVSMPPNSDVHVKVRQVVPELRQTGYVASEIILITDSTRAPLREKLSIKAYPGMTQRTDPYQRFPMQVSLIYFGARTAHPYSGGLQLELEGKGSVDRQNNHQLYVKARGPSQYNVARVTNYDQYTAEYTWQQNRKNKTQVQLGDFAYNLTPLTEMYRWARGVGLSQQFEKMQVGAFYNRPRFFEDIEEQYAAWAEMPLSKSLELRLSGMNKKFSQNRGSAQLLSLQARMQMKGQLVRAEYAMGGMNGQTGPAAGLDASGAFKKLSLSYRTQNVYASRYFPGYYTNSLLSNTTLRFQKKRWAVNAGLTYNDANPAQDSIFTVSPYSTYASLGATYKFFPELQLNLTLQKRSKEDRFPSKKFSYRENSVRYRLTYKGDVWNMRTDGELGQTQNLLVQSEDNTASSFNIRSRVERNLPHGLSLGGFGQYLYTNRYTLDPRSYLFYGGHVSYRHSAHWSLTGSYRNNYLIEEYNSDRSLLDLQLRARWNIHQLNLGVSHALIRNSVSRTDFFISARYTCNIGMPVRKRSDLYSVVGSVRADNPKDASGIILHMAGKSVITDEYGHFEFNDIPPGRHQLYMDRGTLAVGLIATVEMPCEVDVLPGQSKLVRLDVVRSASIIGHLSFPDSSANAPAGETQPLRIIKATQGEREMLTYTDDQGNFSFKQVLPGEWTLRVVQSSSDKKTWIPRQNNIKINLAPGESEELNFVMNKKQRQIQFKSQQPLNLKIEKP